MSWACLLYTSLVIAVLMLSGCHQQSRSAQLDIAVQQPPGVEQPTEAQPTPQARPAKPEQAEDCLLYTSIFAVDVVYHSDKQRLH